MVMVTGNYIQYKNYPRYGSYDMPIFPLTFDGVQHFDGDILLYNICKREDFVILHVNGTVTHVKNVGDEYIIGWIRDGVHDIIIGANRENLVIKSDVGSISFNDETIFGVKGVQANDNIVFTTQSGIVIGCSAIGKRYAYITIIRLFSPRSKDEVVFADMEQYKLDITTYRDRVYLTINLLSVDDIGFIFDIGVSDSKWVYQSRIDDITYSGVGETAIMNHDAFIAQREANIKEGLSLFEPLKKLIVGYI